MTFAAETRANSRSVTSTETRAGRTPNGIWLLLACALALRMWKISDKSLSLDESFSWHVATRPLSQSIALTAGDIHPPLYYLLLKVWISIFGDSLTALRTPSVISSLIGLYLLFRLVDGAMPRVVCYAVMLWCVLSPYSLYFAQEARMYAPAAAAVLGACLAYRRWIDSGFTSRLALLLYAISGTIALYLHYYTAAAIVAIWLHFLLVGARTAGPGRRTWAWLAWILAHTGVAIAYAPWIPTAFAHFTRGQPWRAPVSIGMIPQRTKTTISHLTLGFFTNASLQAVLCVGVLALGAVCLLAAIIRKRDECDIYFASIAYVPLVLALSLLPVYGDVAVWGHLPYSSPLLVAAAARGLNRTGLAPRTVTEMLGVGIVALLPFVSTYYSTSVKDSDYRPIVAYLITHARHGADADPVFIQPEYMDTVVRYYARDAIKYHQLAKKGTDLGSLGDIVSPDAHEAWLIVDVQHSRGVFKLPDFDREPRLQPVEVPGNDPKMIRLFRLAP